MWLRGGCRHNRSRLQCRPGRLDGEYRYLRGGLFGFLSLNLGRDGLSSLGGGLRSLHEFLVRSMNSLLACIQFLDKPLGRLVALLSGLPNLLGRFVSAPGTKAYGGSDFVAGFAFGPYGNISGGFDGLAGQHP